MLRTHERNFSLETLEQISVLKYVQFKRLPGRFYQANFSLKRPIV